MSGEANGRSALLASYGRWYGEQHLAVTFTAGTSGDQAKRVISKGWDQTKPLADGGFGQAYVAGRGGERNPAVVLRPSNLVVLECDTEADLRRIEALALPETITVRSSASYKRHFWYRPPHQLEALPYVAFRFESGKLTADSGRYFLIPPALHPSGQVYTFLPGHGPGALPIAELPEPVYQQLCQQARIEDDELREQIAIDPEAKIKAGKRREMIFRYACMLRRWGLSEQEILQACLEFNKARCHPPVEQHLVQVQVAGAMKKRGDQEIEAALAEPEGFTLTPYTARDLCDEPDLDVGRLLGPLVLSGGRTIIVGDTGEGKTTLAFQIIRAILTGSDFLGYQGAGGEGARALIVDLEQGRRTVKRALRDSHLDRRDDVDLVLVPDGLSLDRDELHRSELDRVIAEGGYTLVLLDPYYKAHRADEPNAERPIVDLMRILDQLRASYGFALILPAHPRKEPPGAGSVRRLTLHDIAGSGAVSRGAEVIIGIERVAHGLARLRYLKDREGDLPIGEAWNLLYTKETGFVRDPKDEAPARDYVQEIRDASQDGEWRTAKDYRDEIKAGENAVRNALETLRQDGEFEYMKGPAGRNSNARCYRPATASAIQMHLNAPDAPGSSTSDEEAAASLHSHSLECREDAAPTHPPAEVHPPSSEPDAEAPPPDDEPEPFPNADQHRDWGAP